MILVILYRHQNEKESVKNETNDIGCSGHYRYRSLWCFPKKKKKTFSHNSNNFLLTNNAASYDAACSISPRYLGATETR
jgi:hypothetical protein